MVTITIRSSDLDLEAGSGRDASQCETCVYCLSKSSSHIITHLQSAIAVAV